MASTSTQMASDSPPSTRRCTYDVFLSFRGEDTRDNFTDHLHTDLVRRGIRTFRDDKLSRGEDIAPKLLKAIEESRSSIVVFSKTYADSRWCLDELAKIMECRREYGKIVIPIFYHVNPSDVRKQTGSFGEAFTKYEVNWKNKVERWREALTEAGNISGWPIKEGSESKHINKITTYIVSRISNYKFLFYENNLVGMDSHWEKLSLKLSMESNDVHMIGICGIGGIGKTTIAQYVYTRISWKFECSSFLANVGKADNDESILHLQNQLHSDTSMGGQKALIVLDDVIDMKQLEFLVGNRNWFGGGSRIIITTKNRQLLANKKYYFYDVEELNSKEALVLFSRYAFQQNLPQEDYENLSNLAIRYCQGLPLALKVLGSLLCGKTIPIWESELNKLKKEPMGDVQNVLRRSFNGLDRSQKKIFLDIACFFEGQDRDFVSKILEGCDLYGVSGISVLCDRCLISISHNNGIYMHALIQQMGQLIVREDYPEDPNKWSRLWTPNDIYRVFTSKKGMDNVETISLDLSRSKEIWFTPKIFNQMKKVFAKMKKLRLLKVYYSHDDKYNVLLPKDFEFPPNLRYLHWEGLESLPLNFHGENLVAIDLKSSKIKELWKGNKCFAELKFIDLSNSQQLMKIPNFSSMPKLERLNLQCCTSFCNLHLSTIGTFPKMKFLRELYFSGSGIKELPSSIGYLESLEYLDLSYCSNFEKFPEIQGNMKCLKTLDLEMTPIKELPNNIGSLRALQCLCLRDTDIKELPNSIGSLEALQSLLLENTAIKELPNSIGSLEALQNLCVSGCSNLKKFPEIQRNMGNLQNLLMGETAIKELPCSIDHLTGLTSLNLFNCKNLSGLPSSIYGLKSLKELSLNGCSNVDTFSEIMVDMEHLKRLCLSGMAIRELPSSIERIKNLEFLELSNCENLVTLPNSIGNLTCLSGLRVRNCSKLHKLPENFKSLQCCLTTLDLAGCNLMEGAIPSDLWCLTSLKSLDVSDNHIRCIPADIIQLSKLRYLSMNHCPMLEEIPDLPSSLREIQAHGCPRLETLSNPTHVLWSSLLNNIKLKNENLGWSDSQIHIIIPGSIGIPEWVSDKSMGCEVKIELPENWYKDDNFLGFTLFSHHIPLDDDEKYKRMDGHCSHDLSIYHGDQFKSRYTFRLHKRCRTYNIIDIPEPNKLGSSPGYDKAGTSDPALYALYLPKIAFSSGYESRQWNNVKASCSGSYFCGDNRAFKVKSCGIHLIYAQPEDVITQQRRIHATKDEDMSSFFSLHQEIHEGEPSGSESSDIDGSESENSNYYSADEGEPTADC